jgi:hypothetical protein
MFYTNTNVLRNKRKYFYQPKFVVELKFLLHCIFVVLLPQLCEHKALLLVECFKSLCACQISIYHKIHSSRVIKLA